MTTTTINDVDNINSNASAMETIRRDPKMAYLEDEDREDKIKNNSERE
jgi:hypothetical protein